MTIDQLVTEVPASAGINARRPATFDELVEIRIVDPTCDPSWDRLASSHIGFTFFHCAAWMRVLCKTYGHKPLAFYCSRRGQPRALLPLLEVASPFTGIRGVGLPFTDFCAPLFFGGCDAKVIFENLCGFAQIRGWKHFELRGRLTTNLLPQPWLAFHGHSLDLRCGADELFVNFASPVRRAIRKAQQSDLSVRLSDSEAAMRDFYWLHARTRRRHGLPPQPFSFFANIHSEVIRSGLGFIILAKDGTKTVAGAMFFHIGSTALFKFGAYDERYQDLRPNNLVMWHAIRYLAENGISALHLGRTSLHQHGLRRFKLGWGVVEEPIEYFRFNIGLNAWSTRTDSPSPVQKALFTRLPLILNRLIGAAIYPHLD